jgi:hypothetical protein
MDDHARIRRKLCRDLARSEREAWRDARHEADRLGEAPPGRALAAIAANIEELREQLDAQLGVHEAPLWRAWLGLTAGFLAVRRFIGDRVFRAERVYRATALRLRRGMDIARVLREIATIDGDAELVQLCDVLLVDRGCLIDEAEDAIAWFARYPHLGLATGGRLLATDAARELEASI